mgnify:CR=1 FL=1
MEAYLDNSATTRCCEEAAQLVVKLLTEDYGNPSSLHNKGVIAENYMNDARKKIAKTLKVQEKEICFTSGVLSPIILQLSVWQRQTSEVENM